MREVDIKVELIRESGVSSVELPSHLDFNFHAGRMTIEMNRSSVVENMQTDGSCFEGWALVLKRWLGIIDTIVLKWDEPLIHFLTPAKMQHYQRFLFRVKKFKADYDWFTYDDQNEGAFCQYVLDREFDYLVNMSGKPRSRVYQTVQSISKYSERQLEEFILSHAETKSAFMEELQLDTIDNQLPVGLFKDIVSNKSKIFTGGASAIDIWGTKNVENNREVYLFELKKSENRKVGALTEMLFYANHTDQVRKKNFKYASSTNPTKLIPDSSKINCYLLAPRTHALIDDSVFDLMNKSNSRIHYGSVEIYKQDDDMKFSVKVR